MSTNTIDADRIGPQIDLEAIELPNDVAQRMQRLFGADDPVTNGAEWIEHTKEAIELKRDRPVGVEDLCDTEDGDHAFESVDGEFYEEYMCVLDPIAYAFITDTPGTVHTVTALHETPIEIRIDEDGVRMDHEGALTSIGVSDHVEYVEEITPKTIYQQVCGYIQTFENEAEYEEWDDAVEAPTTPLMLETGIGAAGSIATTLFE